MNWFMNFMRGRYGVDQLNIALVIFGVLLSIIGRYVIIIYYISCVFFLYAFYRMFSRNQDMRRRENAMFMRVWSPVVACFKTMRIRFADRKTHRYFKCPTCKQRVRVPKDRGKIKIKCPKCKSEFIKKT